MRLEKAHGAAVGLAFLVACAVDPDVGGAQQASYCYGDGGSCYADAPAPYTSDAGTGADASTADAYSAPDAREPVCDEDPPTYSNSQDNSIDGMSLSLGTEKGTFKTAAEVMCRALRIAGWPATTDSIQVKVNGQNSWFLGRDEQCLRTESHTQSGTFGFDVCGWFLEGTGSSSTVTETQQCKECTYGPAYECTTAEGAGCYETTYDRSADLNYGWNFDLGKKFFENIGRNSIFKLAGAGSIEFLTGASIDATETGGQDACTGAECPVTNSGGASGTFGVKLKGSLSGYLWGFGATAEAYGGGSVTWGLTWNDLVESWCLVTDVTADFGVVVKGKVKIGPVAANGTVFKWACTGSHHGDSCVPANNVTRPIECDPIWFVDEEDVDCNPLTCADLNYACGSFETCGQTVNCGGCNVNEQCRARDDSLGTYCLYVSPEDTDCEYRCMYEDCPGSSDPNCFENCVEDYCYGD